MYHCLSFFLLEFLAENWQMQTFSAFEFYVLFERQPVLTQVVYTHKSHNCIQSQIDCHYQAYHEQFHFQMTEE
ncbi:unnamed protein product [Schistosoma mattheei]|uniref:Uncharacterized protein n=1 Tax=Schistosoma mattheei TaxID=31246 RepID=A0A183NLQ4_9TREM|nr:unnamed protein product [Schistosoma mattheei]